MDIQTVILEAKLGRSRREAQEDTCSVFSAALFDLLMEAGVPCKMVTAQKKDGHVWAHAVVEAQGRYFDSMGEFSNEIWRKRARIHPRVETTIHFQDDLREECYEEEFEELYAFYLKQLKKSAQRLASQVG